MQIDHSIGIYMGGPKNPGIHFFKKLCVYFYMFKLQSPLKYFHFMQHTYWDIFSTAKNSFWTRWFWCLLVLLRFLVLPLPHQQNVSLWGSFSLGKQRSFGARSGEYGEWGMGFMPFLVKKCLTLSVVWAGALINHPSWNGQMHWKILQKIPWTPMQPLTTTPAGTPPGFLEHSPSGRTLCCKGPALQNIILFFWGFPSYVRVLTCWTEKTVKGTFKNLFL